DAVLTSPKGEPLLHIVWVDDDPDATLRDTRWPVSAQERFERLLVELQADGGTPMGLVLYPEGVRLCYAPKGEAPGHLTFALEPMLTGDGRLLVDAFVMMLGRARLFTARSDERLLPLLQQSRNRQEDVTVALAEQIEEALELLLAGFDVANARAGGALFAELDNEEGREHLYHGLITVLL